MDIGSNKITKGRKLWIFLGRILCLCESFLVYAEPILLP